jgi:hypothetical protein
LRCVELELERDRGDRQHATQRDDLEHRDRPMKARCGQSARRIGRMQ